jgi:hypothetical protein
MYSRSTGAVVHPQVGFTLRILSVSLPVFFSTKLCITFASRGTLPKSKTNDERSSFPVFSSSPAKSNDAVRIKINTSVITEEKHFIVMYPLVIFTYTNGGY